jgi:hypothetical protein
MKPTLAPIRSLLLPVSLSLGLLLSACGPSVEPFEESALQTVQQGTFGADLGQALGSPVTTNSTCGRTHDFTPSCAYSNSAPDMSYTWTAPSTGSFTFSTAGSAFDTILEVRRYNDQVSLGCNDDVPGTSQSSLTLSLTAGQTLLIVVDGYSTYCGTFQLNITAVAGCPGGCNSPPSQCHQSTGTCTNGTCTYAYKPAGSACSDGRSCTTNDMCNGSGTCGGSSTCNSPPNSCYAAPGVCSSSSTCSYISRCGADEVCSGGRCVSRCTIDPNYPC